MRRHTLGYQMTLLGLVLADLLCAGGAYAGAFFLRVYLPLPFTIDFLPSSRFGEVSHPLLFLLASQIVWLYCLVSTNCTPSSTVAVCWLLWPRRSEYNC